MASEISVIICAYTNERWADLVAAVASAQGQTLPPREVIVVCDHNEALLTRARGEFHDALVVPNREARGLSGARNSGIAIAQGVLLAFLDDDAIADPDWLEHLIAVYEDPRVLGVGGAIDPLWQVDKPSWFPDEFYWVVGCTYRGMPTATAHVRNLFGANMSFRRSAAMVTGGFNSGVGQVGASMLRCDDTDFCIRLRQLLPECDLLHEPRARVKHQVPESRARWKYFCIRCYTEGVAKAQVVRDVGSRDGLSSEWAYTSRILPMGVMMHLKQAILHREIGALVRAAAIIAGLALTTAGYCYGRTLSWYSRQQ